VKDLSQVLMNPIRSRIIQYLSIHKEATVGILSEHISDVPRTTLYRHINILEKSDLIKVISEKKIRGSLEKTYVLNIETYSKENTVENATRNAFGFLMKIYADFDRYFSGNQKKPISEIEQIFLGNVSLLLSDEEFKVFMNEMNQVFGKYISNVQDGSRKQRSISIISSPVISEGE
jgi:DNA-binding transcriptional ArsR family regulator